MSQSNKHDISDYLQNEIKQDTHNDKTITKAQNINSYVNIMKVFVQKSMYNTLRLFNPAALYKKTYIQLDTRNAAYFDGNKTCWYLTKSPHIQQGFINTKYNLHNIVNIRLMNCFIYTNYMYTETWSDRSDLSTRRLAFYIEELGNQAVTLYSGIKFHHLGVTSRISHIIAVIPINILYDQVYYITAEEQFNNGNYTFNNPITLSNKITLMVSDLKKYLSLRPRMIDIIGNIFLSIDVVSPLTISCRVVDNRYSLSVQNFMKYVTLPDITTDDPITDATWITNMRAGSWYILYTFPTIIIYTSLTSAPTALIQPFTIRFTVDLKLLAEFELTYLDTNI